MFVIDEVYPYVGTGVMPVTAFLYPLIWIVEPIMILLLIVISVFDVIFLFEPWI